MEGVQKKLFKNTLIEYDKYIVFINELTKVISSIINAIKQQVYMLQTLLTKIGLFFDSVKFDNYAYVLSDKKIKHLGVNWKGNKIFNKYFYVSFIDWNSGLCQHVNTHKLSIGINDFVKYGKHPLSNICENPYLTNYGKNILNLSESTIKLLTTKYYLALVD